MKDLIMEDGEYNLVDLIIRARGPPSENFTVIIEGKKGKGKSTYAIRVVRRLLMKVYHLTGEEGWEAVKGFIVWTPLQYKAKIDEIAQTIGIAPAIIWDDAGFWLSAYKFREEAIQAVAEYNDYARSHFNCLIMTTPRSSSITRRLRIDPGSYKVRIIKLSADSPPKDDEEKRKARWNRRANIYKWWETPDEKKTGTAHKMSDDFSCKMPDDFYKWYMPQRDAYEAQARKAMGEVWNRVLAEEHKDAGEDYQTTPISIRDNHDTS